ncbi:MAG: hypothetical protein ACFB0Z_07295 [Candidatus Phaeomarinobacter sp.]
MRSLNPCKRQAPTPEHPSTGDPVKDMTQVLLRIEGHLSELSARAKSIDRLERRLQGIETALKHI